MFLCARISKYVLVYLSATLHGLPHLPDMLRSYDLLLVCYVYYISRTTTIYTITKKKKRACDFVFGQSINSALGAKKCWNSATMLVFESCSVPYAIWHLCLSASFPCRRRLRRCRRRFRRQSGCLICSSCESRCTKSVRFKRAAAFTAAGSSGICCSVCRVSRVAAHCFPFCLAIQSVYYCARNTNGFHPPPKPYNRHSD